LNKKITFHAKKDENQVYWSGRNSPKPTRLNIPKKAKIEKIGAAGSSIIAVAGKDNCLRLVYTLDDNKVYMKNKFLDPQDIDDYTGLETADFSTFVKGKILDIGGTYHNKFVIVQEEKV